MELNEEIFPAFIFYGCLFWSRLKHKCNGNSPLYLNRKKIKAQDNGIDKMEMVVPVSDTSSFMFHREFHVCFRCLSIKLMTSHGGVNVACP